MDGHLILVLAALIAPHSYCYLGKHLVCGNHVGVPWLAVRAIQSVDLQCTLNRNPVTLPQVHGHSLGQRTLGLNLEPFNPLLGLLKSILPFAIDPTIKGSPQRSVRRIDGGRVWPQHPNDEHLVETTCQRLLQCLPLGLLTPCLQSPVLPNPSMGLLEVRFQRP